MNKNMEKLKKKRDEEMSEITKPIEE